MKKLLGLVILAPAFVLAWAANVLAVDTFCNSVLEFGSFDNLIAVPGGRCTVRFSTVQGDVKVEPGADLALITTTVGGDVRGKVGSTVIVSFNSLIGGNVVCDQAGGRAGCVIQNSLILGDLEVEGTSGGVLGVLLGGNGGIGVGGTVELIDNVAPVNFNGPVVILGDLECEGNSRVERTFLGAFLVGGDREGQCEDIGL